LAYEQKGRFDEAIAEFKQARLLEPESPYPLAFLAHAYAVAGKKKRRIGC
jgi:Flp pilus assembly protein TadD